MFVSTSIYLRYFAVLWYVFTLLLSTICEAQHTVKAPDDLPSVEELKARVNHYQSIRDSMNTTASVLFEATMQKLQAGAESWLSDWERHLRHFSDKPNYSECKPGETVNKLKALQAEIQTNATECSRNAMQTFFSDFVKHNMTTAALELSLESSAKRNVTRELVEDDDGKVVDDGEPIFSPLEIAAVLSCAPEYQVDSPFLEESSKRLKKAQDLSFECFLYYVMEKTKRCDTIVKEFITCMNETSHRNEDSPLRSAFHSEVAPSLKSLVEYRDDLMDMYDKAHSKVAKRLHRWLPSWIDELDAINIDELSCPNPTFELNALSANLTVAAAKCLADAFDHLTIQTVRLEEKSRLMNSLEERAERIIKSTSVEGLSKNEIDKLFHVYLGHIVNKIAEETQRGIDAEAKYEMERLIGEAKACWKKEMKIINSEGIKIINVHKVCARNAQEAIIPPQDIYDLALESEIYLSVQYFAKWHEDLIEDVMKFSSHPGYDDCFQNTAEILQELQAKAKRRALEHLQQSSNRLIEASAIASGVSDVLEYTLRAHKSNKYAAAGFSMCRLEAIQKSIPTSEAFTLDDLAVEEAVVNELRDEALAAIDDFKECVFASKSRLLKPVNVASTKDEL